MVEKPGKTTQLENCISTLLQLTKNGDYEE